MLRETEKHLPGESHMGEGNKGESKEGRKGTSQYESDVEQKKSQPEKKRKTHLDEPWSKIVINKNIVTIALEAVLIVNHLSLER